MSKLNNKVKNIIKNYLKSDSIKERAALQNKVDDIVENYLKNNNGLDFNRGMTFYYPDAKEGEMGSLEEALGDGYINVIFDRGGPRCELQISLEDLDV